MARLVGKGAHVGGADIQKVIGLMRAIGPAFAQPRAPLHQAHLHRRMPAQEVHRRQEPAEAAADHGDDGRDFDTLSPHNGRPRQGRTAVRANAAGSGRGLGGLRGYQ